MNMNLMLNPSWKAVDEASLGLIYGAITVLSILMSSQESPVAPYRPAILLFLSVLAMTLARAFSEMLAQALLTRERFLTVSAAKAAWRRVHPTLSVANVPTLVMIASGRGLVDFSTAVALSQLFCVGILVVLGARVGSAIKPRSWLPLGGAAFVGGIGSALAALKYAIR